MMEPSELKEAIVTRAAMAPEDQTLLREGRLVSAPEILLRILACLIRIEAKLDADKPMVP